MSTAQAPRDLIRARDLARDLARECPLDIFQATAWILESSSTGVALNRAQDWAHRSVRILEGDRATGAHERARELGYDLERAYTCAVSVASLLDGVRLRNLRQRKAKCVFTPVTFALAIALRLLPNIDRARYAEEYLAEVRELAQSGAGRRRQVRYALSQLRSVPQMWFVLRSLRRWGAPS